MPDNESTSLGPMTVANRWLDAGIWASVRVRVTGPDTKSPKPAAVGPLLVMLARSQYGSKASLDRLLDAHTHGEALDQAKARYMEKILNTFEVLHQAQNFIVAIDTFWESFKKLRARVNLDELEIAWKATTTDRRQSRQARHHIEHVAERIALGRANPPMAPTDFRKKLGIFDGEKIWFGDESFDVVTMHDAILRVGRRVAPALEEQLTLRATIVPPDPRWLS